MAGLGETASVIAVLQLSSKIIKYVGNVKDASSDRKLLRDSIRGCRHILQDLKDEIDDSEEGKAWTSTIEALELSDGPLDRLQKILLQVEVKLQAKDGLRSSLGWPFREKDVRKLIEAIEQEKSLLSLALSKNSGRLLQEIRLHTKEHGKRLVDLMNALKDSVQENENKLQDTNDKLSSIQASQTGLETIIQDVNQVQLDEKASIERRSILDWLSVTDYALQQQDVIRRRQEGTGSWLLNSDSYQTWLGSNNQTLFCPGIPGAGKTVIASIINADLWERYHNDSTIGLAFLFCDFRRRELDTIENLLSGLLKQLVTGQLPRLVKDFYEQHGKGRRQPSLAAISGVLRSLVALYSKVFIVVDGLDECQADTGCRARLLSELFDLQQRSSINLLATSRPIPEVTRFFQGYPIQEIRASNDDVQMYLDEQLHRLPGFVQNNPALQKDIKDQILKAVDGMFLLAKLHTDSLVGKRSAKAIRTALGNLITGSQAYDSAYSAAMERIEGQVADQIELAKQTLVWITCARSPLSPLQLQEALAIEIDEVNLDPENYSDIEDVVSACAGLVVVDTEGNIMRLVHYTTQEYLERTIQRWFPNAQTMITNVCTTYLSLPLPDSPAPSDPHGWVVTLPVPDSLFSYAAPNWGHHARLALNSLSFSCVMDFLRKPANITKAAAEMEKMDRLPFAWIHDPAYLGLHVAAYFGLEEAVTILLQEGLDVDQVNSVGTTPLIIASWKNQEVIAKLLLDRGARVDIDSSDGYTALHYAAKYGRDAIVGLLLAHGANTECKRIKVDGPPFVNFADSPLHAAARYGHESCVKQFLASNVSLANLKTGDGRTPLHDAVGSGRVPIVAYLLQHNVDVNYEDENGSTPLCYAVYNANGGAAKLLLAAGADVDAKFGFGSTILMGAIMESDYDMVKLLVEGGADADLVDGSNCSPLICAAEGGSVAIIKLLLHHGANLHYAYEGGSALHGAAYAGHEAVVQLLIDEGADLNVQDRSGETALLRARRSLTETEAERAEAEKGWGTTNNFDHVPLRESQICCIEFLEAKTAELAPNTPVQGSEGGASIQ